MRSSRALIVTAASGFGLHLLILVLVCKLYNLLQKKILENIVRVSCSEIKIIAWMLFFLESIVMLKEISRRSKPKMQKLGAKRLPEREFPFSG